MADAGSSVDARNEEQKGKHGPFLEAGLGLERLGDGRQVIANAFLSFARHLLAISSGFSFILIFFSIIASRQCFSSS